MGSSWIIYMHLFCGGWVSTFHFNPLYERYFRLTELISSGIVYLIQNSRITGKQNVKGLVLRCSLPWLSENRNRIKIPPWLVIKLNFDPTFSLRLYSIHPTINYVRELGIASIICNDIQRVSWSLRGVDERKPLSTRLTNPVRRPSLCNPSHKAPE